MTNRFTYTLLALTLLTAAPLVAQQTATSSITLTFTPACAISTTPPPPTGVAGKPYSATFSTTNCIAPLTWSIAAGSTLPAGLTLNSSTGVISGTGPAAGSYTFTLEVTDSSKNTSLLQLKLEDGSTIAMVVATTTK